MKITKVCYCSLQACWCVYSRGGDFIDKGQTDSTTVSVYRAVPSAAAYIKGKTETISACSEAWKGDTLWVEHYLILRNLDTFLTDRGHNMIVGQEHRYFTHSFTLKCYISSCRKLKVLFFHEAYSKRHGHHLITNKWQALMQYSHITCTCHIFIFQCKKVTGEDML